MRRLLTALALTGIVYTGAMAQVDSVGTTTRRAPYHLFAGVHVGLGGVGFNPETVDGRKVNPALYALPAYGVTIFAPFGGPATRIGARLDLGVSTIGTQTRPAEFYDSKTDWQGYFIEQYRYFTIAPAINLAGAYVGVGINIPMQGTMWNPNRSDDDYIVDRTTMKTAMDIRLGGMINAMSTKVGNLYIDFQFRYLFGGIYNDGTYTVGSEVDQAGEPGENRNISTIGNVTPLGFQLGVAYLFDLSL